MSLKYMATITLVAIVGIVLFKLAASRLPIPGLKAVADMV